MGIGRTFTEAFLKAMRSRELDTWRRRRGATSTTCRPACIRGSSPSSTASARALAACGSLDDVDWLRLKRLGLSDADIAPPAAWGRRRRAPPGRSSRSTAASTRAPARSRRRRTTSTPRGARPTRRRRRATKPRVVILGSGPNRIGQGIEFDYCCVHAAQSFRSLGYEAVMVNCNPETVSTDYDTSDRLYFEPLGAEEVLAVCEREQPDGIAIQFGGQTPLKLAPCSAEAGFRDPRHAARRGRPRRGPRALRRALRRARRPLPGLGHRPPPGRGGGGRRADRLPGARASVARAGRPRDARLLLGRRRPRGDGGHPGADARRPLPRERGRDRRRRALRRRRDLRRRGDGARRGGRRPLRRLVLRAAARRRSTPRRAPRSRRSCTGSRPRSASSGSSTSSSRRAAARCSCSRRTRARRARCRSRARRPASTSSARPARSPPAHRLADLDLPRGRTPAEVAVKAAVLPFARFPGSDPVLGPEMRSTGEVMASGPDFSERVREGRARGRAARCPKAARRSSP